MFRFALSHGLTVMLPHKGHILSEKRVNWLPKAMYPPSGERYFDILCNHVIFNEKSVRVRLHADTVFIGIVRHPFDQFVSSFNYYRNVLHFHILMNISGDDPVSTYLSNPKIWEPKEPRLSRTHNRMSIDFGMEPVRMKSAIYVNRYLDYLDRKFHLVLVSERFDESMILMKRHLGWKLKDVLYMKQNVHGSKPQGYTDTQRAAHKLFNMADYALYEHFSGLFDKRVAAQGAAFGEEVKTYVSVRNSVEKFCLANDTTMESLRVAASLWSEEFWVSKTDCSFMKLEEVPFVMTLRSRLYQNEIN
nr:hypothetical protein BaRGS_011016 [Batillaria attramentaria]